MQVMEEELLSNQKCIAVGETGLDYSYPEFGPTHRDVQKRYFEHFISYANKYHLPAILHIRSGIKEESISDRGVVDADEDAISIFKVNPPKFGAVYQDSRCERSKYIAFIMGYCRADSDCSWNYNRKNN